MWAVAPKFKTTISDLEGAGRLLEFIDFPRHKQTVVKCHLFSSADKSPPNNGNNIIKYRTLVGFLLSEQTGTDKSLPHYHPWLLWWNSFSSSVPLITWKLHTSYAWHISHSFGKQLQKNGDRKSSLLSLVRHGCISPTQRSIYVYGMLFDTIVANEETNCTEKVLVFLVFLESSPPLKSGNFGGFSSSICYSSPSLPPVISILDEWWKKRTKWERLTSTIPSLRVLLQNYFNSQMQSKNCRLPAAGYETTHREWINCKWWDNLCALRNLGGSFLLLLLLLSQLNKVPRERNRQTPPKLFTVFTRTGSPIRFSGSYFHMPKIMLINHGSTEASEDNQGDTLFSSIVTVTR